MTEPTLSAQDVKDLESMGISADAEEAQPRSLLEVWDEVLSNVLPSSETPIPMQVAHKVVRSWPFLSYQDTAVYHNLYHRYLLALIPPLKKVIAENPVALTYHGEEDGAQNHKHYVDLLVQWHLGFDQVEEAWRASDPESHIVLAAVVDARAMVFGHTGLVGHFDAIGFHVSDEEFAAALESAKEAQ
jgi:hypothetical protein